MKYHLSICCTALLIGLLAAPTMAANLSDSTNIHGFGGWAYGQTNGSDYLTGSEEGDYGNAEFYLNIQSQPSEKLSISAQVGWLNDSVESYVDFDFAFAEYAFSHAARVRIGRVKHPYGIYGEIQRVGTLRPFLTLPQGIYGPFGLIGNGYNGVGLTGDVYTDNGWELGYDLYGGQLQDDLALPNLLVWAFTGDPDQFNDGIGRFEERLDELIGFRLNVSTPVAGLRFGFSGYTGTLNSELFADGTNRELLGAHLEYQDKGLLIRAEYMNLEQGEPPNGRDHVDALIDSYYLEAAYRFTNHWELAARYDVLDEEISVGGVDAVLPRFIEESTNHEDLSFGVTYWFDSHFAVKASYHMVTGLAFGRARFEDAFTVLLLEDFDNDTDLVQFGGQFSF